MYAEKERKIKQEKMTVERKDFGDKREHCFYLPVLHQICPHAGTITTTHEHMVGEEVDAR